MPPGSRLDGSDDDDENEHSDDDNGRHSAARRRAARSLDRARDRSVDDDERRERQHETKANLAIEMNVEW